MSDRPALLPDPSNYVTVSVSRRQPKETSESLATLDTRSEVGAVKQACSSARELAEAMGLEPRFAPGDPPNEGNGHSLSYVIEDAEGEEICTCRTEALATLVAAALNESAG